MAMPIGTVEKTEHLKILLKNINESVTISLGDFMSTHDATPVNKNLNKYKKELRLNMTNEEKKLWYTYLNKINPKFHRQGNFGNYIVDFHCPKLRAIIEIDGCQHYEDENLKYDEKRTLFLESLGYKVLRIDNSDVNKRFMDVEREIKHFCKERAEEMKYKGDLSFPYEE